MMCAAGVWLVDSHISRGFRGSGAGTTLFDTLRVPFLRAETMGWLEQHALCNRLLPLSAGKSPVLSLSVIGYHRLRKESSTLRCASTHAHTASKLQSTLVVICCERCTNARTCEELTLMISVTPINEHIHYKHTNPHEW